MRIENAAPLPTNETLAFVLSEVGGSGKRILEVGAGTGELAVLLGGAGHHVLALDSSSDAVEAARRRGIEAEVCAWPDYRGGPYDVILFTRSLHHLDPLAEAVGRAAEVLAPGGLALVEDFAFSEVHGSTIRWFRSILEELVSSAELERDPEAFAWRILEARDPAEAWFRDAAHIHPDSAIRRHLADRFRVVREAGAPYLYRYLAPLVSGSVLAEAHRAEAEAIADGSIDPLGRRYSAEEPLRR